MASSVLVVDKELPLELLGPLVCDSATGAGAVFNTANPQAGEALLIFWVGVVGLSAVMGAQSTSATKTIAIALHDSRRELVRQYGATHVMNSGTQDPIDKIGKAIEKSGSGATINPVLVLDAS
jgi:aryl-alcohol dehydrogenase